ncbi:methyltransferase [Tsukamurella tyrosinosolvens]|uniref:MT-A70 family methyltransferase n=1 Tax=Tsukamurella tyrosinosolvens TaxID=57704 RepID=UPI001CE091B6|nr:MT-A70 family methyltransferase [Tsukamurella tyrosinosolvens]MCA4996801.1 methyltransferase [Tsukamurella tyrosinosolvens]
MISQNQDPSPGDAVAPRFRTILADPPWDVQQQGGRGASTHYKLMTLNRIKRMPIKDLADDNAHLWLWVTNATLRDGYDVAEAWGFTVRSPLTWVKFRLGLGNYLRNSTEHLLFATRGKAPVQYRAQPTWINAPVTDHSHKPEEQYALIERVSPGPYLELFARRRPLSTSEWAVWGNQIDSTICIPGYPVPSDNRLRQHKKGGRDASA